MELAWRVVPSKSSSSRAPLRRSGLGCLLTNPAAAGAENSASGESTAPSCRMGDAGAGTYHRQGMGRPSSGNAATGSECISPSGGDRRDIVGWRGGSAAGQLEPLRQPGAASATAGAVSATGSVGAGSRVAPLYSDTHWIWSGSTRCDAEASTGFVLDFLMRRCFRGRSRRSFFHDWRGSRDSFRRFRSRIGAAYSWTASTSGAGGGAKGCSSHCRSGRAGVWQGSPNDPARRVSPAQSHAGAGLRFSCRVPVAATRSACVARELLAPAGTAPPSHPSASVYRLAGGASVTEAWGAEGCEDEGCPDVVSSLPLRYFESDSPGRIRGSGPPSDPVSG